MDVLTSLRRIPVGDLFLHEAHEPARLKKTCEAIQREGMLRHPILATPMDHGYLVLDGAHRLQSLRELGCSFAPVQVLERGQFVLSAWDHQVPDGEWLDHWLDRSGVICRPSSEGTSGERVIATMIRNHQRFCLLLKTDNHLEHLAVWRQLVATYSSRFKVCRLPQHPVTQTDPGMVCFQHPVWELEDLMETVLQGQVLPAGVTRFMVEGRLLNLCIPLTVLNDHELAETQWNQSLNFWRDHLRSYTEKVYLCEA
ncbi:ParB N-terminal domain-containing protein [Lihuaxuella thermophila]|uniref:ParB-like nuclease domain-containing protein n=1 Tax=Lihuaxuella thermophila TaxID=1173111 RepID=A0A1H8DDZ0_9BACL|nr:ParB N-terminal domain-containing protein [Lihuaxuella thermophila]SEN05473.1 ParB-like nuclease domain-containing protein [Lihuaxuella thermophila]